MYTLITANLVKKFSEGLVEIPNLMFVMNAVVLLCLMKQNHWALKLNSSAYRILIPIYQYCDGARYPNAMLMGYIITCSVVLTHSVHDGQVTI